jgi:competence protein ComEA
LFEAFDRYRWLVVAVLAAPLLIGVGWMLRERLNDPDPLVIEAGELPDADIQVYVTGAVVAPGVYPLPEGSRWIDALTAAGGVTAEANLAAVNLARRAQDEDQIIVPVIGSVVAGATQSPVALVDLNMASERELEALPGIGEVRAARIVQSRTTDGPFSAAEDLVLRDLVPASMFEDIAALVTVR